MSADKHVHTILYAEDDADDLFMVRQAFAQFDHSVQLRHAIDGYQTLELLKEARVDNSLPCLVILDVNMPGMDGKETLMRIKSSENFHKIPVVLFTTSNSSADKAFAEKWGAEFITKPLVFSELEKLARNFLDICSSSVAKESIG